MDEHYQSASDYIGVVLAAGFGSRLKPISNLIPKPLVPFMGIPLLHINLNRLARVGVEEAIVNTHHLSDEICKAVDLFPSIIQIQTSIEDEILGTGGAYGQMHRMRKGKPLLVINGDVVTSFSFKNILSEHKKSKAAATMGLLPSPHDSSQSAVWIKNNEVLAIGGESPEEGCTAHGFSCVQVLSDRFLSTIKPGSKESIVHYYKMAIADGEKIAARVEDCCWYDLGTPQTYMSSHKCYLNRLSSDLTSMDKDEFGVFDFSKKFLNTSYTLFYEDFCDKKNNCILSPSLVGCGVSLERNCFIGPNTVISGKVDVQKNACIKGSLIYDDLIIPSQKKLSNALFHNGHFFNL